MGARGKYRPDVVNAICKAIQESGRDEIGAKAGGVALSTFYRWLNDKSEFKEVVARAKDRFRGKLWDEDPELFNKAVEGLKKHLTGDFSEEWRVTITHPDGSITKKVTRVRRLPSAWAIKLVLGVEQPDTGDSKERERLKRLTDIAKALGGNYSKAEIEDGKPARDGLRSLMGNTVTGEC